MGQLKVSDNAATTLAASIGNSPGVTSITLADASKFPVVNHTGVGDDWSYVTLFDSANNFEIVKVTRRDNLSNALTIVRGTAMGLSGYTDADCKAWASTSTGVACRLIAQVINDISTAAANAEADADAAAASAAAAVAGVKVTTADTTSGKLDEKITVSGNLSKSVINPGGNELLNFTVTIPVTSVFGRTGAVVLQGSDVTGALGYTPYNFGANTPWHSGNFTPSSKLDAVAATIASTLGATYVQNATYATSSGSCSGNAATASQATNATNVNGGSVSATSGTFSGSVTVGNGAGASSITMADSDEGSRTIHCNSNNVGFLTQAGGWGSWCDDGGNWSAAANVIAYASDVRLKKNFAVIDGALDKVAKLGGYEFDWDMDVCGRVGFNPSSLHEQGLKAQEVAEVVPNAVHHAPFDIGMDGKSKSGDDYLTVSYDRLVPLLIAAINELRAEVAALKERA